MLNSTQIILNTANNPHRANSLDARRWNLIGALQTVGAFVARHNHEGSLESGGLGDTWHAKRYLKYMAQRGLITLPGVEFRPRVARMLETTALSSDLAEFTFGVELEVILPRGMSHAAAAEEVNLAGVACRAEVYNHNVGNTWKVVTDGSLGDYIRGAEFVSPVLRGQDGLTQVETVCRTLKAIGVKVNKRCGMHVHVGVADQPVEFFRALLVNYSRNETLIDSVMPASRRGSNNQYCQPTQAPYGLADMTRDQVLRANHSRYRKVNLQSFWRHQTVEFRQHAGTVEADKASYWVKFCLRACLQAKTFVQHPRAADLTSMLVAMGASAEEQTFFSNRAAHFGGALNRRAA